MTDEEDQIVMAEAKEANVERDREVEEQRQAQDDAVAEDQMRRQQQQEDARELRRRKKEEQMALQTEEVRQRERTPQKVKMTPAFDAAESADEMGDISILGGGNNGNDNPPPRRVTATSAGSPPPFNPFALNQNPDDAKKYKRDVAVRQKETAPEFILSRRELSNASLSPSEARREVNITHYGDGSHPSGELIPWFGAGRPKTYTGKKKQKVVGDNSPVEYTGFNPFRLNPSASEASAYKKNVEKRHAIITASESEKELQSLYTGFNPFALNQSREDVKKYKKDTSVGFKESKKAFSSSQGELSALGGGVFGSASMHFGGVGELPVPFWGAGKPKNYGKPKKGVVGDNSPVRFEGFNPFAINPTDKDRKRYGDIIKSREPMVDREFQAYEAEELKKKQLAARIAPKIVPVEDKDDTAENILRQYGSRYPAFGYSPIEMAVISNKKKSKIVKETKKIGSDIKGSDVQAKAIAAAAIMIAGGGGSEASKKALQEMLPDSEEYKVKPQNIGEGAGKPVGRFAPYADPEKAADYARVVNYGFQTSEGQGGKYNLAFFDYPTRHMIKNPESKATDKSIAPMGLAGFLGGLSKEAEPISNSYLSAQKSQRQKAATKEKNQIQKEYREELAYRHDTDTETKNKRLYETGKLLEEYDHTIFFEKKESEFKEDKARKDANIDAGVRRARLRTLTDVWGSYQKKRTKESLSDLKSIFAQEAFEKSALTDTVSVKKRNAGDDKLHTKVLDVFDPRVTQDQYELKNWNAKSSPYDKMKAKVAGNKTPWIEQPKEEKWYNKNSFINMHTKALGGAKDDLFLGIQHRKETDAKRSIFYGAGLQPVGVTTATPLGHFPRKSGKPTRAPANLLNRTELAFFKSPLSRGRPVKGRTRRARRKIVVANRKRTQKMMKAGKGSFLEKMFW